MCPPKHYAIKYEINPWMHTDNDVDQSKAQEEYKNFSLDNTCYRYAAIRYVLYKKGKKIEVVSSFYPQVQYVAEWFKQLFGESEGKSPGAMPCGGARQTFPSLKGLPAPTRHVREKPHPPSKAPLLRTRPFPQNDYAPGESPHL